MYNIFNPTRHRVNHLILVAASLKDFWFPIDRVGFLSGRVILFVNLEDKKELRKFTVLG